MVKKNYDVDRIIELYEKEHKNMYEVSKIIGNVSTSTVRRILINNGINIRYKGNRTYHIKSPLKQEVEDVAKMIEMFNDCVPINQISKSLNVGRRAVIRKIQELNLERPKSMRSREQYDDSKDELIISMYNSGVCPEKIASEVGLSRASVKNHLKHNNIRLRNISEGLFIHNNKDFPEELTKYETLYDMYIIQGLSKKNIAKTLNVSPNVVDRCLKQFEIKVRGVRECKIGLFVGNKHPNWKGGRSSLYTRLREYFRVWQIKDVLKRDDYKCQICGSTKKLQVHHIRKFSDIFNEILDENDNLDINENESELYDIMTNDSRLNDTNNLITYCKDCHLFKVHGYKKHDK